MAAIALAALVCYLIPSTATARSPRAVVSAVLLIGFGWLVVAYLVGPRGEAATSIVLLAAGVMAFSAAWKSIDPQARTWLGAFGLALLLIGAPDLWLSAALVDGFDRARVSALIGAVGCAVLIAGRRLAPGAAAAVVGAAWVAWLVTLVRPLQDQAWVLLWFLAAVSAACLLAAWVGRDAGVAVTGAVVGELAWLIALSTGRGPGTAAPAPLEAYTLGSLAVALLLIALLIRAHRVSWTTARQAVAALAVAVGVASLSALAWSLGHGSTAQTAGLGWVGLAGLGGWLLDPARPSHGPRWCGYCGDRDQSGDRAHRFPDRATWADPACLGVCRDAGRQRPGADRLIRAVSRRP